MKTLLRLGAGLMAVGGALLLYAWGGERPRMSVQCYGLTLPEGAGAGLRILHLSDQHFGGDSWVRRSRLKRIRKILLDPNPTSFCSPAIFCTTIPVWTPWKRCS